MKRWQLNVEHDRVKRDAFVACGNKPPTEPDPPDSVVEIAKIALFNGPVFWAYMENRGHNATVFRDCQCGK